MSPNATAKPARSTGKRSPRPVGRPKPASTAHQSANAPPQPAERSNAPAARSGPSNISQRRPPRSRHPRRCRNSRRNETARTAAARSASSRCSPRPKWHVRRSRSPPRRSDRTSPLTTAMLLSSAGEFQRVPLRSFTDPRQNSLAKKIEAALRIPLASFRSRTSRPRSSIRCRSFDVGPGTCRASTWACTVHRRSDSTPTPDLRPDG